MPRSLTTLVLAAFLSVAPACANNPAQNGDCQDGAPAGVGGEFTATISGAEDVEFCGFATSSGQAGFGWSLQLLTPGGANSILIIGAEGEGRPDSNTYDIADYQANDATAPANEYVVLIAFEEDILGTTGFSSVEGRLTITSSSPTQVSGEFDFEARDSQGGATISVTGTFTSTNQDL
jgi:hypothetical protein